MPSKERLVSADDLFAFRRFQWRLNPGKSLKPEAQARFDDVRQRVDAHVQHAEVTAASADEGVRNFRNRVMNTLRRALAQESLRLQKQGMNPRYAREIIIQSLDFLVKMRRGSDLDYIIPLLLLVDRSRDEDGTKVPQVALNKLKRKNFVFKK